MSRKQVALTLAIAIFLVFSAGCIGGDSNSANKTQVPSNEQQQQPQDDSQQTDVDVSNGTDFGAFEKAHNQALKQKGIYTLSVKSNVGAFNQTYESHVDLSNKLIKSTRKTSSKSQSTTTHLWVSGKQAYVKYTTQEQGTQYTSTKFRADRPFTKAGTTKDWGFEILSRAEYQKVGTETVFGENMTKYRADQMKMLTKSQVESGSELYTLLILQSSQFRQSQSPFVLSNYSATFYVDDAGIIRKYVIDATVRAGSDTVDVTQKFEIENFPSQSPEKPDWTSKVKEN